VVFVVFAIQIIVGIPFTKTKEGVSVFAIFSALVIRVVDYLLQAPSVFWTVLGAPTQIKMPTEPRVFLAGLVA
jgi:hypothetical protein